ncbi:hypothetical protein [Luteococcus sp. OSA5]|uniref:hypothetical protein n=1 Tax=Luteococcus sp. OSA5 TaxID=3401630 RepID=UPI003B431EEB
MAKLLEKLPIGRMGGRNALLLFDTAVTALTNVIVVIAASRSLGAGPLDSFSLAQLVLVMLTQSVRTAIWSPAMAAQRKTGKARIPLGWVGLLSPSVAVTVAALMAVLIPRNGVGHIQWWATLAVCSTALLAQDGLRSVLMSRDQTQGALIADIAALAIITVGLLSGRLPSTASGILLFWSLAVGAALAIGLSYLSRNREVGTLPAQSLAETWRFGRWGALDAAFSSFATLLPFFVATLYVANTSAGPYRILQTAMGPLNIIFTTILTAFSLDSWQSADRAGLRALNRKTLRLTAALGLGVLFYVMIGIPAMIYIAKVSHPDLPRIALIVAVNGILGTAIAAVNAATLALGYQRFGALIRFTVVVLTVLISLPWTVNHVIPWRDPIGVSMLTTALVTMSGWVIGYAIAYRRELRRPARAMPESDPIPHDCPSAPRRGLQ